MSFQSITVQEYCPSINYSFKIQNLRDTKLIDILIISFQGKYRNGSSGSPDAGLIKGIVKLGVCVFDPFGLIIDLRDLEYNWGDDFDLIFEEEMHINSVLLIGEKCRKAMSTLMFGIHSEKDIVDNIFFFDDYDKALARLNDKKV